LQGIVIEKYGCKKLQKSDYTLVGKPIKGRIWSYMQKKRGKDQN